MKKIITKLNFNRGWFKKGEHNKTEFKKGMIVWNKGKKLSDDERRRISIYTKKGMIKAKLEGKEIGRKKGCISWSYIDGRSREENRKSRKKKNGKEISHIIWCSQQDNFYRVPKGCIIHHLDLNPLNNNPNNLQLLEDKYHRSIHMQIIKLMKGSGIASAI